MGTSAGRRDPSLLLVLASCLICSVAVHGAELSVSNVQISPRPGSLLIDVTYDLQTVDGQPALIRLFLSTDGGMIYSAQCQTVSGAVGEGVLPANGLHIVWDAGADLPGSSHDQCRLRVAADDSPHAADFQFLAPGTYLMGSPADEPGRAGDEARHAVTLTQGFFMARTPVTEERWNEVMGEPVTNSSLPRIQMSWDTAVAFCNAQSLQEGLTPAYIIHGPDGDVTWDRQADGYRLPTEAEWEYACRAGEPTAFAGGSLTYPECSPLDPVLDQSGWYCGNTSELQPVAQKAPNAWGLHDMHGNAGEWVWDGYRADHDNLDPVDPVHDVVPGAGRVWRGGHWSSQAQDCRSAYRGNGGLAPDSPGDGRIGLRLARTAFPSADADPGNGEWSQHGHDAQRTGYAEDAVPLPWRWKWSWNGPDATGGIVQGKTSLPRNVQPVTGGGRVYISRGDGGVVALAESDGSVVWTRNVGGRVDATVAHDGGGGLLVPSTSGILYRLDPATGNTLHTFDAGAAIATPPCVSGDRVFISAGATVHALARTDLTPIWSYDAGSPVQTPPSFSAARGLVIACTADLHVHAIDSHTAQQVWRVKPSPRTPSNDVSFTHGWPVIAEGQGLVLVKLRLDWNTLWTWSPWPTSNAAIRANLLSQPDQQVLFALNLDDGSVPFVCNVGHGGYGDNNYLPMGPQPVVKRFDDGTEVAYIMIRGKAGAGIDGRWDTNFGELVLDDSTVAGLQAGDVRWIAYDGSVSSGGYPAPTDEQHNVTMAGDHLLGGHWMAGQPLQILDRSDSRGSYAMPITSANLPHIVTSTSVVPYSPGHDSDVNLVQDGDPRSFPPGFYIYHDQGTVYDQYWSEYAVWTVSNGTAYFRSCDGAIVALEHGETAASRRGAAMGRGAPGLATPGDSMEPAAGGGEVPRIDLADAARHGGERVRITGTLRLVHNNGKMVLLGFADPHAGVAKILIRKACWESFAGLGLEMGRDRAGRYREGQTIEAVGKIEWYQGDPVIFAGDPGQIRVLPSVGE